MDINWARNPGVGTKYRSTSGNEMGDQLADATPISAVRSEAQTGWLRVQCHLSCPRAVSYSIPCLEPESYQNHIMISLLWVDRSIRALYSLGVTRIFGEGGSRGVQPRCSRVKASTRYLGVVEARVAEVPFLPGLVCIFPNRAKLTS